MTLRAVWQRGDVRRVRAIQLPSAGRQPSGKDIFNHPITMNTFISTFRPAAGFSFVIQDHETALLFQHGRYLRALEAGKHRLWSAGHEVKRIDNREQMLQVQGQELLTADQVVLKVSAVATFRVADALTMHRATQDAAAVLYSEVQLALRQIVAAEAAEAFLQQKAGHGTKLLELITDRAQSLGLKVDRIDIRDVMLPADLKRSFMSALQQRQEAQAGLEKARAETAALRTLANAAKLMRDNPELLQLRYLQTLQEVGTGFGNTLVLGLTDSERLKGTVKA
jgi:regulator of protease activity HflC (stomatin/prohibitin superfamily)